MQAGVWGDLQGYQFQSQWSDHKSSPGSSDASGSESEEDMSSSVVDNQPNDQWQNGNTLLSRIVHSLGVVLDRHLNMEAHIKTACRASFAQLANISRIRSMLSRKTCETLVHAFVTTKLDYCNSLLYDLPARTLCHLQRVQNMAARIVTKTRKHDHITPVLCDLHWLSVKQRIDFKILTLAFRAIHGQAPEYIEELVVPYAPSHSLRSAHLRLLKEPSSRLKRCGQSFAFAAASL